MGGGQEHAPRKDALENKEAHDFHAESPYGTHDTWDMRTPFGPYAWMKYWIINTSIGVSILYYAISNSMNKHRGGK